MNTKTTETINTLKAHLAINVKNLAESIEFYKKMLGLEPSKVRTGYAKFDVVNPPLNFTLNQVPFGERGALSHLGIQVASTQDVLAMRAKWHERGLATRDEMNTNCCYAIQDKTWTRDPDGNEWEVFVVKKENLAKTEVRRSTGEDTGKTIDAAPTVREIQNEIKADASCACETKAPAAGETACCETQAVKFGIESASRAGASCCAPAPVGIKSKAVSRCCN